MLQVQVLSPVPSLGILIGMKLIYRIKFRAFGITFGSQSGEVSLASKIKSDYVLTAIAEYITTGMDFVLVNDRGVYIAVLKLNPHEG